MGCTNLSDVAKAAKDAGITVIMIGYGDANTAKCKKNYTTNPPTYSGGNVDDVLAAAASAAPNGLVSKADPTAHRSGAIDENSDGDFYFCAANGAQLAGIFSTAVSQIASGTKFVKMPGS